MAENCPSALFIADSIGLDFLNTRRLRRGQEVEVLADGDSLISWLVQSELLEPKAAERLRRSGSDPERNYIASQARELREWFRRFVDEHMGQVLPAASAVNLAPLNRLLLDDDTRSQVVAKDQSGGGGFWRVSIREWSTLSSLLLPIGDALADVVCHVDFTRIKQCEARNCMLVFADTSRGQGRRWCCMSTCGNRAKQAARRKRSKTLSELMD
jgi:predicted RNA-binding Zn ribbon-like protein